VVRLCEFVADCKIRPLASRNVIRLPEESAAPIDLLSPRLQLRQTNYSASSAVRGFLWRDSNRWSISDFSRVRL